MPRPSCLVAVLWAALGGASACTSFATVRSAEVRPGPSLTAQASFASRPGDEASWFWSLDCAERCDHSIPGADLTVAYGASSGTGPAYTIGLGLDAPLPYAEAYVQLGSSERRPFGVGARVGLPVLSWTQHQVYGRLDLPLGRDARLLWNPGLVYHTGQSPNGENTGAFVGLVQGLGLQVGDGPVVLVPSVAVVWGRAWHDSYGARHGPASRVFGTAALSVTFRRGE